MDQVVQIQPGWDVYGTDSEKIGSVESVGANYIAVRKGMILPSTHYVPFEAIQSAQPSEAYVIVGATKDQFDQMGWDQIPAETATTTDAYASTGSTTGYTAATATDVAAGGAAETQRVARYEEELQAQKSTAQTGEVQVRKSVTEDQATLDVPVRRDEVTVRRVAVDRPATGVEQAFQDGETLRVPVTAEQITVTKQPRVVEEIEIQRTPVQETQRVSDTVRREQVAIDQSGDVNVDDRSADLVGAGSDRMQRSSFDDAARIGDTTDEDAEPLV